MKDYNTNTKKVTREGVFSLNQDKLYKFNSIHEVINLATTLMLEDKEAGIKKENLNYSFEAIDILNKKASELKGE